MLDASLSAWTLTSRAMRTWDSGMPFFVTQLLDPNNNGVNTIGSSRGLWDLTLRKGVKQGTTQRKA